MTEKRILASLVLGVAGGETGGADPPTGSAVKPLTGGETVGATATDKPSPIDMRTFLETIPPGSTVDLTGVNFVDARRNLVSFGYSPPPIELHCDHPSCGRKMLFDSEDHVYLSVRGDSLHFFHYRCRNCKESRKFFALLFHFEPPHVEQATKLGELPAFGPQFPPKLITLAGPSKDLLIKARRCESQGLGVGAFAYYRRVVDDRWKELLERITEVAEKTGASAESVATLRRAAGEQSFERAVSLVKSAIPPSLLIGADNPITLLYSTLSDGLHDGDDEECLRRATAVRTVLVALSDRLEIALREENELRAAVGKLKQRSPKTDSSAPK